MARRSRSPSKTPRKPPRRRERQAKPDAPQQTGVRGLTHRLARMALELAADRQRAPARKLTSGEIEALLDVGDDPRPIPSSDLLAEALAGLPERRRAILIAVLLEDTPRHVIARRFGISTRTLDTELRHALLEALRYVEQMRRIGPKL
ncbi:sigma factor-like helix-turn-helix DNA-binding protein [Hyphomicrobium sp. CS1BSMeth3]|uniref:sigma factor-like helix-turn-helix DNA-binding protein n=1 Tax=Hyphomicrobium sp. CS1BSMeth3 TaxID=1892844 RepID=UPI00092FF5F5|nr:sigma factor-like helix-turn-helix DNA-binding protein [Hyphomicrobium sp. CS1BSMeth3]